MGTVKITEDAVYIYDENGLEIVSWTEDEFKEDTDAVFAALNAVQVFHAEGATALKNVLNN